MILNCKNIFSLFSGINTSAARPFLPAHLIVTVEENAWISLRVWLEKFLGMDHFDVTPLGGWKLSVCNT